MAVVTRLIFNVSGQTLTHVPARRIASATFSLENMLASTTDASRVLASGAGTLDAASQALTAAAGPSQADPRRIQVAATAAYAVGVTYQIADVSGDSELIVCAGIEANAAITAVHPLTRAYTATTSTIQGIRFTSAALALSIVNNESRMQGDDPLRAIWVYPNGERHQQIVRIVRNDYSDADVAQAIIDIRDLFPDVVTRLERHGRDTLPTHVELVRRQLRTRWIDRGEDPEATLAGEQGHWALVWRTMMHLAQLGNAPSIDTVTLATWQEYCRNESDAAWARLTIGEGGREVQKQDAPTDTASTSTDRTYRKVIGEL
jgi:hypothetical protein